MQLFVRDRHKIIKGNIRLENKERERERGTDRQGGGETCRQTGRQTDNLTVRVRPADDRTTIIAENVI